MTTRPRSPPSARAAARRPERRAHDEPVPGSRADPRRSRGAGPVFPDVQPDLSIGSEWTLEPKAARRAFDLIRDEGLDVWGYCGNETVIGDFAGVLKRAAKVVGVSDDHDLVQRCRATSGKGLGGDGSTPAPSHITST